MSKERLETIKELVKKIESILYDEWRQQELTFLIESLYYAGHVDWLLQQAERVHELESDSYNAHLERLLDRKEQEIGRYREALEFYADGGNYEPEHYDPDTHDYTSMIDHDKGATARKALEGEK